jgi:hypothetical protein
MGTLAIWFVVFFGLLAVLGCIFALAAAVDYVGSKFGPIGGLIGFFVVVAAVMATIIAVATSSV